jgi:glycosyltransferase involved in cell wall biosynthesis
MYLPSIGGTEIHTRELSIELAKLGHQVSIFTTDAMYIYDLFPKIGHKAKCLGEAIFKDSNVGVYRFHVINSLFVSFFIKCLNVACDGAGKIGLSRQDVFDCISALQHSPFTPRLYFKLINSTHFDIANSTPFPYGYSLLLKNICKRKRIPFVITPRAHTIGLVHMPSFLLRTARESDAVIALTEHERMFFIEKGVPRDKIFVTGIGVRPESYLAGDGASFKASHKIPKDSKIVLFIGRIDEGKGVELLLKSMRIVWKKISDVRLVILGRSTEDTERIVCLTQNEKRTLILADATERTKNDALSSSNLLVLPSIYESFGGVFLEAWLAGKPVIGCRVPAISCVVDDMVDGLLASPNENEFAEKIIYLLENEAEAQKMGERGNEKVLRNYTWKAIAAKTLEVYESISKK